jgi:tRNA-splicing ligase RtcB
VAWGKGRQIKQAIKDVLAQPDTFTDYEHFGQFARDVISDREFVRPDAIDYRTWGTEIDKAAHGQMKQACSVPMAAGAALMPDAHVGYGLPIGGVLALENAVIPYAVGVDIARSCSMYSSTSSESLCAVFGPRRLAISPGSPACWKAARIW